MLSSCVGAAVSWEVEKRVKEAQQQQTDQGTGPPNHLFVSHSVHSQVLQWGHFSQLACHPLATRTLSLLQRRFWWPIMLKYIKVFVSACPTCSRNKVSHWPPTGLLHPLPVPSWPWSHITLDFVTGLPASKSNTTILSTVDRFSKAVHFVALPNLPSAREMANRLVHNVFHQHVLPVDIVLDRLTPVHVAFVEVILPVPWSHSQSVVRLPSPDQRSGGKD